MPKLCPSSCASTWNISKFSIRFRFANIKISVDILFEALNPCLQMTFKTYKSTRSICPLSFIQIHSITVAKFRNKCDACNASTTSVAKPGIGISYYAVPTSNVRFQFRLPNIIVCCPMFILVPFLLWSYGGPYRLKKVHQTNLVCCLKTYYYSTAV